MARTLPLLLLLLLLTALVGASFLHCDDHLGSCEPEPGPADEPVLARLLPAQQPASRPAGTRDRDRDAAARPAAAEDASDGRRESDNTGQKTIGDRTAASDSGKRGQAVTSETVSNSKREPQSGVSNDALQRRPGEDNSRQNTPVAVTKKLQQASTAQDVPKISTENSLQHATPAAAATKTSAPKKSNVTQKASKQSPGNKVVVPVQLENVATKAQEQTTVVPSESTIRKKREIRSDIPSQAVVPSPKSDNGAGKGKAVQSESFRSGASRSQESASEGQRKAAGNSVNTVSAGAKEGMGKPSASNVNSAQELIPPSSVSKEAQKQGKRVTEKQSRQQESIQRTTKPEVPQRVPPKDSPTSGDSKVNPNTVYKHHSVKSRSIADNGGASQSGEGMPKTPKQSQSHGSDQKEVVKRFRSSEESHGAGKTEKTHPVKSQGSHHQENLQGKVRKTTRSAEGKDVSETKSRSVVAPNKIVSDTSKENVKHPSSQLSDVEFGEYDAANNKVIASVMRNTQHTLAKVKNNDTSQLKQNVNMQDEKQRVRREIGDHSTFSIRSETSQVDTDHFGEMQLNESVQNETAKKVTFSNRSASLDDSYKTASTTIIVDGNLFKGSGSKTWKLSSLTNTSENEVSRKAATEKKSTKPPGSLFADSESVSLEKSSRSNNRTNSSEIDKSKKIEESPEVPIIPSSHESVLKSTPLSKPEITQSGVQIMQDQAERTGSIRDKSTDVDPATVFSDEEAPISSPSRGEAMLRVKRDAKGEVKLVVRNENMRDDTPALVEETITNSKAGKQPQEKVNSESQEVTKLKKEDNGTAPALAKGMKSVKTEVIANGTDSRNEQTTEEQLKGLDERKSEESVSSSPSLVADTGINSSESVTEVSAGLLNQKIEKGEPVSQKLVSIREGGDCDKDSKPLAEPAATERSGSIEGEGEISLVTTERSEESKEALSSVINDSSTISSDGGTDTPVIVDGTDTGADASQGELERGGPVAEAIVSQPPETDGPSGSPLESETGDSLPGAVAQKWVMPESNDRAEERRDQAVQPQEEDEEAQRLLLLADRLRQRDGGRRDIEDNRDLEEPQLHFPSVPQGEDFHTDKLGLSDGIFLFGYLSTFISWLQPNDFPVELVRDALWNRVSITDLITETLQVEVGFIAVVSVGVALALAVPLTALGLTCCRLLEARADCRDQEPSACRRRSLLCGLWTVLLLMAVGVAAMFASNEQVSAAVQWSPSVLHTALSDTAAFVRSTHHQIGFVASKSLDQALAAAVEDLDNADALLGAPIQRELSRETGVDVALDALSDVSAAAEGASQRAAGVLEQAAQARGLALVARERLADLRYQLDAARRQCAARDRPLCDTVDAVGLDVSVRLDTLLSDERLLALRDLRSGNLSAAAQQARADFQLLPRQLLETTRDARLGIRRELVRERAQLQEALSPLDAFSRSVSGRVDGARAAAQDAARLVAGADYWRWLAGLGAALVMLVIWLLLAAGGGCGCCGSQEKARPLLITAVATASVVSVLLWAVTLAAFALGAHGEVLACRPLFSAPDYPQLSRLLDRPGVLFPAGGFFRNVAGSNASLDVPLKDVLQECELGRPAYEALQLRQLFDSDAATGRGGQWEGVRQQVARLRVELAELRVLTPGLQAQLEDTLRAASANLTQHRLALQGPVTNRDLQALADQLLSVSSQVTDLSSASRLETLAARAKRLLSSHISPLEQRKEDLVYQLTALEVALSPLQRQTNQSLSHLKTIQYFVGKQGESIARAAVRRYADRLLGYLQQARQHVLAQVGRHVANCRPLFDVFHAARQLLCRHAVDPLNGLWFSSAWCLVLLVVAVPLSLRLADAYRRRDSSASLLSSRNSEWQVEKSSKDYY